MISSQSIQELLQALENGEIVPYFQPQIDLRTGGLLGFEVLARWHHPKRGLILPDHFIPIVEVGKLMNIFTERVASAAAGTARHWPKHLKLAINISASQLHDPSLAERLQSAVERGGLRMDRIVVEVTESALIQDLRQARLVLEDLHRTGARLSIDDFGTGYSSLCNLEALPFDEIKVDACFVRPITQRQEIRKIVAAVIGLANSLGLNTVAEGVEEQAQANLLACLGCEAAQGWLYCRAIPAEEITGQISKFQSRAEEIASRSSSASSYRVEARPEEQSAQLRAIYDVVPIGLCFLDQKLRYVDLNGQLAQMHGVPLEAHLGRSLPEVLPNLARVVEPHVYRALAGEPTLNVKVQVELPSPARAFLVSYQPARNEAGNVVGVLIAVQDVT